MRKGPEYKYLHEIYSRKDIEIVSAVCRTYDCRYSPIMLNAPEQAFRCRSWSNCHKSKLFPYDIDTGQDDIYSLKLWYAIEVWHMATAAFLEMSRWPKLWEFEWGDGDGYFRELKTNNANYEQYKAEFWQCLKDIANSGCIKVREGVSSYCEHKPHNEFHRRGEEPPRLETEINSRIILNIDNIRDWENGEGRDFNLDEYHFDYGPISYAWDEIKDMFVELTVPQVALCDGDYLNKHNDLDLELEKACERFDVEAVKTKISEGANVNALVGVFGETIITETIDSIHYGEKTIDELDNMSKEEESDMVNNNIKIAKIIIDLLIDNGADIDLYGFGLGTPLLQCYYSNSAEMMSFLLDRGANPNVFSNISDEISFGCDQWYVKSEVLMTIEDSIDGDAAEECKMLELLKAHGAKMYIDGYNPRKYFK
jgi:hypothetical protein